MDVWCIHDPWRSLKRAAVEGASRRVRKDVFFSRCERNAAPTRPERDKKGQHFACVLMAWFPPVSRAAQTISAPRANNIGPLTRSRPAAPAVALAVVED